METGKLVRDRIPEIIRSTGRTPIVRTLGDKEFDEALRAKIVEEALELAEAPVEAMLSEIADVLEVVDALRVHHGFSSKVLAARRRKKAEERGAFDQRHYLAEVLTREST